jgi:mannose-6-phosphate isomerase-like protein (cupin superfamily)
MDGLAVGTGRNRMQIIRRVITGVDADGRSCVVADGPVESRYELEARGGLGLASLFELPIPPRTEHDGVITADRPTLVPGPGYARVIRTFHPPDKAGAAGAAGAAEVAGAADSGDDADRQQHFDASRGPNMHATATIDVIVVMNGRIDLILETGPVPLDTGDVVVQRGTWHSWSNPYGEPCELIGVNFALTDDA